MSDSEQLDDVEFRVISDVDGHVTEFRDPEDAEQRARELDEEFEGQTHRVEKEALPW